MSRIDHSLFNKKIIKYIITTRLDLLKKISKELSRFSSQIKLPAMKLYIREYSRHWQQGYIFWGKFSEKRALLAPRK